MPEKIKEVQNGQNGSSEFRVKTVVRWAGKYKEIEYHISFRALLSPVKFRFILRTIVIIQKC